MFEARRLIPRAFFSALRNAGSRVIETCISYAFDNLQTLNTPAWTIFQAAGSHVRRQLFVQLGVLVLATEQQFEVELLRVAQLHRVRDISMEWMNDAVDSFAWAARQIMLKFEWFQVLLVDTPVEPTQVIQSLYEFLMEVMLGMVHYMKRIKPKKDNAHLDHDDGDGVFVVVVEGRARSNSVLDATMQVSTDAWRLFKHRYLTADQYEPHTSEMIAAAAAPSSSSSPPATTEHQPAEMKLEVELEVEQEQEQEQETTTTTTTTPRTSLLDAVVKEDSEELLHMAAATATTTPTMVRAVTMMTTQHQENTAMEKISKKAHTLHKRTITNTKCITM